MTRYAVRIIAGEYKAIAVFDERAERMEEQEPMVYSTMAQAKAVATRLNTVEGLADEGQREDAEEYLRGDES